MAAATQNCPIHNSPDCYKPALDAHIQKAYDVETGHGCDEQPWPVFLGRSP